MKLDSRKYRNLDYTNTFYLRHINQFSFRHDYSRKVTNYGPTWHLFVPGGKDASLYF